MQSILKLNEKDKHMHPCLEDFIAIAKHSYEAF